MNKCFAYDPEKGCRILTDNSGCGKNCPFRKTKAQAEADIKAAEKRLASLPEIRRRYIAETYYRGKRPAWLPKKKKAVKK